MSIILFEGLDRVGKDTQIRQLIKSKKFDSPVVIHCGSPQELTPEWSTKYYNSIYRMMSQFPSMNFIMNRSSLGEYVYGKLYRGIEYVPSEIVSPHNHSHDVHIITLLVNDPLVVLNRDDGDSHTTDFNTKAIEIQRFTEITNYFGSTPIYCDGLSIEQVSQRIMDTF